MIYFIADTHFYHNNIIKHCERPFSDVNEMNNTMINNWNSLVSKNDDVYILGDFAYKAKRASDVNEVLSQLKGKKYLIKGNHDNYLNDPLFDPDAYEWVKDYFILRNKNKDFILSHYPILEWHHYYHGSIHLYGHVHNRCLKDNEFNEKIKILGNRAINVGVDVNDFYPVSIQQIIEKVKTAESENNKESI